MSSPVTLERRGAIGVLRINNPPVNALNPEVVYGLKALIEQFEADQNLKALVICADGRTFVAGGDITQFSKPDFEATTFNGTLARIENSNRPVVAVLHGTVLGGGLELAMACHYRI